MGGFALSEVAEVGLVIKGAGLVLPASTGTCTSNAVTINKTQGVVTSESLTTAAGASQALTITNSKVSAGDIALVTMNGGTNTAGTLEVKAVCTSNTLTITLTNRHAANAFNGTFIFGFVIVKTATT